MFQLLLTPVVFVFLVGKVVDEKSNGRIVQIQRGKVLVVRLETFPGTDYRWKVEKYNPKNLQFLGASVTKGKSKTAKVGQADSQTFRFKAESPSESFLILYYYRVFDKEAGKTWAIKVIVVP